MGEEWRRIVKRIEQLARQLADMLEHEANRLPSPDSVDGFEKQLELKLRYNDVQRAKNRAYDIIETAMRYK